LPGPILAFRGEEAGKGRASGESLLMLRVAPSPFGKSLRKYPRKEGFTGKREDSIGRERCYQDGGQVSCATGQVQPSPPKAEEPSQAAGGVSKEHRELQRVVASNLLAPLTRDSHRHIPPEAKQEYQEAVASIMGRLSQKALHRVMKNTGNVRYHASADDLTDALCREDPALNDSVTAARAAAEEEARITGQPPKKVVVAGCYYRRTLDLDGATDLWGKKIPVVQLQAHEISHAIDGVNHELSSSREWEEAFEKEISKGEISDYSKKSLAEGFAEFGRLVLGGAPLPVVKKRFPVSYAAFEKLGVI
jgi:hypothetical protein